MLYIVTFIWDSGEIYTVEIFTYMDIYCICNYCNAIDQWFSDWSWSTTSNAHFVGLPISDTLISCSLMSS